MNEITVSIISVTYRPGVSFLKTLGSIMALKSKEIEFILIDGGSGPEFTDLIAPFLPDINTFISEKDGGIYEAMNKGWNLAKGKFLLFINDGDELLDLPLETLKKSLADVLLGSVILTGNELFKPENSFTLKIRNTWPHQGTFYSRNLPFRYCTDYKIFADFDLNQKLNKSGIQIELLDPLKPIAFHDTRGISHQKSSLPEFYSILSKNQGTWAVWAAFIHFKWMGLKTRLFSR